jgi:uncharacterized membrane protein YccC
MPRKTRRQLVGKKEDVEREGREAALRALEDELHHQQQENSEDPLQVISEPMEMLGSLFQAKTMLLTVHP